MMRLSDIALEQQEAFVRSGVITAIWDAYGVAVGAEGLNHVGRITPLTMDGTMRQQRLTMINVIEQFLKLELDARLEIVLRRVQLWDDYRKGLISQDYVFEDR